MKKHLLFELFSVTKYPLLFVIICWGIFTINLKWSLGIYELGISPRTLSGLKGVVFSPFIHVDFGHVLNNTFPILILGSIIFYFYKTIAWPIIFWIYLISGFWLWVGGRNNDIIPNYHFGASTLIYGFSTFIFFSGIFRRHKPLMLISAFVVFMYGSIVYGIFPIDTKISWEGHLFGALSGVLVAYTYRKEGTQAKVYEWPDEEIDLEGIYEEQLKTQEIQAESQIDSIDFNTQNEIEIIYHFKQTKDTHLNGSNN